jgi:hypothetical protein
MRRWLLALTVSLVPSLTAAQWPARTVDAGEARLHYIIVAGEGPAVVLIYGWALSLREWHDQVAALA